MSHVWAKRALFAAVLLVLPVQFFVLKASGAEPYPALFMPNFGSVPEDEGAIEVTSTTVTAETRDGARVTIDPIALVPNRTKLGESIADHFFADKARVDATAQSGWLLDRLQEQIPDEDLVSVTVERRILLVDAHTREVIRELDPEGYDVRLGGRE